LVVTGPNYIFYCGNHVTVKARSVATRIPPLGDIYEPACAMTLPLNVRAMWLLFHLALPASLFVCLFYWMLINPVYKLSQAPMYMDVFAHEIIEAPEKGTRVIKHEKNAFVVV